MPFWQLSETFSRTTNVLWVIWCHACILTQYNTVLPLTLCTPTPHSLRSRSSGECHSPDLHKCEKRGMFEIVRNEKRVQVEEWKFLLSSNRWQTGREKILECKSWLNVATSSRISREQTTSIFKVSSSLFPNFFSKYLQFLKIVAREYSLQLAIANHREWIPDSFVSRCEGEKFTSTREKWYFRRAASLRIVSGKCPPSPRHFSNRSTSKNNFELGRTIGDA